MPARSSNRRTAQPQRAWSRRALLLVCSMMIVLSGIGSHGQAPADTPGLNYFKNFFVTGSFATASVDFGSQSGGGGFVTGTITVDQPDELIPNDADVVAAFLYWQTIITTGQALPTAGLEFTTSVETFDISDLANEVASRPLDATFSPCWTGGGGGNTTFTMKTFRADVRRLLPYATDPDTGLPIGKALFNNQSFQVKLPDNGTGNQTPQTAGASIVVIYRLPTETLKSVVLYDGLQLKLNDGAATHQTLRGFYDAKSNPVAKLSLLTGSGAKNATEQVKFGGGYVDPNAPNVVTDPTIATNRFFTRESNSPGSDRAWDGITLSVGNTLVQSPPQNSVYGEQVTVTLTHGSLTPYDCLATSAMVFSTEVVDTDFDGLLDVWESSATPLLEPGTDQPLPNLNAMGASPSVQDIFFDVAFMRFGDDDRNTDLLYSTPAGSVAEHTHLLSEAALNDIAGMFQNAAPRKNPANLNQSISGPIKVHFDVGQKYQGNLNVIPATLATGGEELPETEVCPVGGTCSFPGFRGVVGWKRGFQVLKEPLFDHNRRHMFRFVLLAHALGVPSDDDPTTQGVDESKWPRSISGASDAGDGGGDFVITLGMWDDHTGTEFVQKSTFVHEFGHIAGLRHGGEQSTATFASVNCKPTYLSVMNYLFQVRGLIGQNAPVIDYSRQDLQLATGLTGPGNSDLNESSLRETALREGNTAASFPTRWYAPKAGAFLDNLVNTSASTRHCDGSPLDPENNPADAIDMVRVDGAYPIGRVD